MQDRVTAVFNFCLTSLLFYCCPSFYRAMHYSAKRSIEIACRLSVHLSVTLVECDHIGWKSWKLIARTINPTSLLFVAQRPSTYSQGNGEILGRLEVEWEKWRAVAQKWQYLKCIKMDEKLLWRAYRKSQTLFRTVPSPTPYGLPFPKIGRSQPQPKTAIAIISGMA